MTAVELNNLWSYLQGLALSQRDRKWLAGKLVESTNDKRIIKQKAFVKDSLYRALDEVERAKCGECEMMTEEEFLEGLKRDGIL